MMTRHQDLINRLCEDGWSPAKGWKTAIRERILTQPFCGDEGCDGLEISEKLDEIGLVPDAYRIIVEHAENGWGEPTLVVEIAEVVVTHHISDWKMKSYEDLWWHFDGSDRVHMRLVVVDRYGTLATLMDIVPDEIRR